MIIRLPYVARLRKPLTIAHLMRCKHFLDHSGELLKIANPLPDRRLFPLRLMLGRVDVENISSHFESFLLIRFRQEA